MTKRKFIPLTAAAILSAICTAAPAMAADTANITIDGTGSEYKAYRLMDLETRLKGSCGHGEGEAHGKDCYDYLYTVNEKYRDVLRQAAGAFGFDVNGDGSLSDNELKVGLSSLGAEDTRRFADALVPLTKAMEAEYTVAGKTFAASQGWYLITEAVKGEGTDSYSLAMLDTSGREDITVTSKEGIPSVTKKILIENPDGGFTKVDASDAAAGDTILYEASITLPDNVADYREYSFTLHDAGNGITTAEGGAELFVDGKAASCTTQDEEAADGCLLHKTIRLSDITVDGRKPDITKDTVLTVRYTGKIKEEGFISTSKGNTNEAWLTFTNNPYEEDETDTTPKDKVATFTYTVTANKTDADKAPLSGAGFTLFKQDGQGNGWAEVKALDAGTSFMFEGLGPGNYKLAETKVPDGYTKADDLFFTIRGIFETESDDPELTGLEILDAEGNVISSGDDASFSVDVTQASAATDIVNVRGVKLPGTGALSLLILTVGGAVLVFGGCGALFVLRRKKGA